MYPTTCLSRHHVSIRIVDFNAAKTESMLLTRKTIHLIHPDLIMNNTILKEVEVHKHLGLIFSQNCGWQAHIDDILKKSMAAFEHYKTI